MPRLLTLSLLAVAALSGCQNDRNFKLFGYSTQPQFDEGIRTVYVPVFKNIAFETTPYRDFEVDISKALVREIETRTRMKVVSNRDEADTELLGKLVSIRKGVVNVNQQSLIREAEITTTVDIVWRDLRTGRILSNRRQRPPVDAPTPFDPSVTLPEPTPEREKAIPAQVVAVGRILPELGESNATANQAIANQLAKQIVNMMESPW
ncbi:LPS assembly lipoprotein LptE [Limnoglobus roseus]|uniref:Penicillin-binding protein activator LpoB n=1 Tax=Limnoglobus roseus TaxID=2598579 RepID=A0A5C1ALM3_9BACT|nr:LPS assembly lipoprotein LptE [Limnoglobus roseus]QEL19053.1 hypothetical protein PX52LOC_06107 [Limnoglobus roseus]